MAKPHTRPDSYASVLTGLIKKSGLSPQDFAKEIGVSEDLLRSALRSQSHLGLEISDAIARAVSKGDPEGRVDPRIGPLLRRLKSDEEALVFKVAQERGPMREVLYLLATERERLMAELAAVKEQLAALSVKTPVMWGGCVGCCAGAQRAV